MIGKRIAWIVGGILAVLATGSIGLTQLGNRPIEAVESATSLAADNAQAAIPPLKFPKISWRPPPLPQGLPVVLESAPVKDAIEQGISTFRALRRGEPAEKVAVDVGCAVMSSGLEKTDSYGSIEREAYMYLPTEFRKDQKYNWAVAKPMGKVITALTAVSGSEGGSAYYFAKYCLVQQ